MQNINSDGSTNTVWHQPGIQLKIHHRRRSQFAVYSVYMAHWEPERR